VAAATGRHFARARAGAADADVAPLGAALLDFDGGALGVFTATSLMPQPTSVTLRVIAEGVQVAIALAGVTVTTAAGVAAHAATANSLGRQDHAFLAAVAADDPDAVLCTYADALATHRLCQAIAERIEGG
jgi:hypothetical protein